MSDQDPRQERRLSFGTVAEEYERTRPGYPDALVDALVRTAHLEHGDPVLEIGAGTGKATRLLLSHELQVTALEPDGAMAAVAERYAAGAAVILSSFEDWPLPSTPFAAVVAAQSWHWVDDEIGPRKAAEALRRAGWIALLWNRPELDGCAWHDDLQPIYKRIVPGMEHGMEKMFVDSRQRAVEHLGRSGRFGEPVGLGFPWVATYTTDEYMDLLNTHSDKRILPDAQRSELFAAIRASLDEAGGTIEHPYVAELVASPVLDR
jgi:SAM-dependent methyltransferase